MAQKLSAGLPNELDLGQGWIVQLAAVDPTTGAAVSGVTFSNVTLHVGLVQGAAGELAFPSVEPLWIPLPLNGE